MPLKSLDCLRDLRDMYEAASVEDVYDAYDQVLIACEIVLCSDCWAVRDLYGVYEAVSMCSLACQCVHQVACLPATPLPQHLDHPPAPSSFNISSSLMMPACSPAWEPAARSPWRSPPPC